MLQFTDRQGGGRVWINPQQVVATIDPRTGDGCTLLMAGGFEIQIQETAADATAQINKRLNAY